MSIALITAGADLGQPDYDGHTPLQFAYSRNENPCVAMALLGASAALLSRDEMVSLPFELKSPETDRHALPGFTLDRVLKQAKMIAAKAGRKGPRTSRLSPTKHLH